MSSTQRVTSPIGGFRDAIGAVEASSSDTAPPVDDVTADCLVEPRTEQALAETLRHATGSGVAVIPFGGGMHLGLGNPPAAYDVALATRRLDAVVAYEPADMTVTVQPGLRLSDLQALLRTQGQLLPLDPPGDPATTVGGMLATNAQGPLRHAHGTARDWVIGMRVAMADGTVTKSGGRVVKNVTGYDLHKLHIGALGTLGIIAEVTFKLLPAARSSASAIASFPSAANAIQLITRAADAGLTLTSAEVLSPSAGRRIAGSGDWCALLRFGAGGMAVERSLRDAGHLAAELGGSLESISEDASWGIWRTLLAERDLALRAGVRPTHVPELLRELESDLQDSAPVLSSTVSAGFVRIRLTPPAGEGAAAFSRARETTARYGGVLVVESADAALKGEIGDVFGGSRPDLAIMRRLKEAYDPKRTLAPGRFMGRL